MAATYLTAFLLTWMCVQHTIALQHRDLEMLGVQLCPSKNTCGEMEGADFSERTCECDSSCSFYRDCCIDAPVSRSRQTSQEICMQFGSEIYNGAYVIANCPNGYSGPAEIVSQCQNGNDSDPIASAPVTDTLNWKTYKNQYCAVCSEASFTSLQSWVVSITCPPQDGTEDSEPSLEDLTFRADLNRWGFNRGGNFHACSLAYDKPEYITSGLRLCRANLISQCPRNYRRAQYKRNCESYTSVVTDRRNNLYRNPHCAICNDVRTDDIECFNPTIFGRKAKPFSFAMLLDVNRSDGDLVGMTQRCSNGQRWDPFFKKCRTLVCALPGYRMVNGRCQRQ